MKTYKSAGSSEGTRNPYSFYAKWSLKGQDVNRNRPRFRVTVFLLAAIILIPMFGGVTSQVLANPNAAIQTPVETAFTVTNNEAVVSASEESVEVVSTLNIGNSCGAAGTNCLPLWRWGSAVPWTHAGGARVAVLEGGLAPLSAMFLQIGGMGWWVLGGIVGLSDSDGWINIFLVRINEIFLIMADFIIRDTPLFGLVLFLGILGASSILFKRGVGGGLMTQLAMFVIPLAILFGFIASAREGDPALAGAPIEQQIQALPTGSPAWIAHRGLQLVEGVADNTVGRLLGATSRFGSLDEEGNLIIGGRGGDPLSCEHYIAELHAQSGADATFKALSRFYELSYLRNFYQVQYGDVEIGEAIGCRLLETKDAGIPPDAQARFMEAAARPGVNAPPAKAFIALDEHPDDTLREVMSWGICTAPGASGGGGWLLASEGEGANYDCDAWATSGDWNDAEVAGGTRFEEVQTAFAAAAAVDSAQATKEFNAYRSLTMRHTSIIGGLMAAITGVVFLFTLGGLALGAALAGIILVAMLMLLPATLLALAIPSTRQLGSKLMAWTGGAIFAKLALTMLLAIMVFLTDITNQVLGGLTGTFGMILIPAVPLLIWFLMRKILQKVGMGGLMTMKGGLNATGATAGKIQGGGGGGGGGSNRLGGSAERRMREGANKGRQMAGVAALQAGSVAADGAASQYRRRRSVRAQQRALQSDPETASFIAAAGAQTRIDGVIASGHAVKSNGETRTTSDGEVIYNADYAAKKAAKGRDMIVGVGSAIPTPVIGGVNSEAPEHWVNYLPDELKARRTDADGKYESEQAWVTRLQSYGDVAGVSDSWSATDLLSSKDREAVQNGNYSSLNKVARIKISSRVVEAAEKGSGVSERFRTVESRETHARNVNVHKQAQSSNSTDTKQVIDDWRKQHSIPKSKNRRF